MKQKSSIFTGIVVLAMGIVLVLTHKSISSTGVIIAGGVIFLLAGIINLVFFSGKNELFDKNGNKVQSGRTSMSRTFSIISGIASVVLGLCMLIFQSTFASLIPFIFGCIIAIGALLQLYYLAVGVRPYALSPWLYLVPLALAAGAIYIFARETPADDAMIMLITGIALILFGVAAFAEAIMLTSSINKSQKPNSHINIAEKDTLPPHLD